MINTVLTTIIEKLKEYLDSFYEFPEEIAELGPIMSTGNGPVNKLCLSLLNIERETAIGIQGSYRETADSYLKTVPPWHLNLYFILAAVYEEKRYAESLKFLSTAIEFIQLHPYIEIPDGRKISMEPVTINLEGLNNIWGMFGGKYYPSIIGKLRGLTFDGNDITGTASKIQKTEVNRNTH